MIHIFPLKETKLHFEKGKKKKHFSNILFWVDKDKIEQNGYKEQIF